jgi:hypothetical protein
MMLILLTAAALAAAPQQPAPKKTAPPPPLTLTGCIGGGKAPGDPLTITSVDRTIVYRLSGMNMRRYIGQRVSIVGTSDPRRLKIVGGLTPSPNAAAQAGALDPAKAAIAAEPLSTAAKSDQQLPELRVKSVQRLEGGCQ